MFDLSPDDAGWIITLVVAAIFILGVGALAFSLRG
jgi:hypothetical protein